MCPGCLSWPWGFSSQPITCWGGHVELGFCSKAGVCEEPPDAGWAWGWLSRSLVDAPVGAPACRSGARSQSQRECSRPLLPNTRLSALQSMAHRPVANPSTVVPLRKEGPPQMGGLAASAGSLHPPCSRLSLVQHGSLPTVMCPPRPYCGPAQDLAACWTLCLPEGGS